MDSHWGVGLLPDPTFVSKLLAVVGIAFTSWFGQNKELFVDRLLPPTGTNDNNHIGVGPISATPAGDRSPIDEVNEGLAISDQDLWRLLEDNFGISPEDRAAFYAMILSPEYLQGIADELENGTIPIETLRNLSLSAEGTALYPLLQTLQGMDDYVFTVAQTGETLTDGELLFRDLVKNPFITSQLAIGEMKDTEGSLLDETIANPSLIEELVHSPFLTATMSELFASEGMSQLLAQQMFSTSDEEGNSLFNQSVQAAVEAALNAPTDEYGLEGPNNSLQSMQWDIESLKRRIDAINALNFSAGEQATKLQNIEEKFQGQLEMLNVRISALEHGGINSDTYRPLDSGNPPEITPGQAG